MARTAFQRLFVCALFGPLGLGISLSAGEIHEAAECGDVEKIRLLLKTKSELVNIRDAAGNTPLHYAVLRDHAEAVEALLAAGSDGEFESHGVRFGCMGSEIAALLRYHDILRKTQAFVAEHPDLIREHSKSADEMLIEAVRTGVPEAVDLLLEHKLNPNISVVPHAPSPLWEAVLGYIDFIHTGPRHRSRLEPTKGEAHLARCYKVEQTQRLAIIKSLLSHKADVNIRDDSHRAMLNRVTDDTLDIAALLVSFGADYNATCNDPCVSSPFHEAIEGGQIKLVQFFMDHGADPKGKSGPTPLHIASQFQNS